MVLWEITLATAYFLGLKKTYRLGLKIQRHVITSPKFRQFAQRRTRAVFDVVLRVHRNIQERDIEVGRNLGNWILRKLDRAKPSAQISLSSHKSHAAEGIAVAKNVNNLNNLKALQSTSVKAALRRTSERGADWVARRRLLLSRRGPWIRPFPTFSIMMRPPYSWTSFHYRQFNSGPEMLKPISFGKNASDGVFRDDIRQWMLRN